MPEDAFLDAEDGNTRRLTLRLRCPFLTYDVGNVSAKNARLPSLDVSRRDMRWLVWQKHNQSLQCVAPGLNNIGIHRCILSARDKDGNEVNGKSVLMLKRSA